MVWPLNIKEMKREMGTRTRTRKGGKGGRGRKEERRRKGVKRNQERRKEKCASYLHLFTAQIRVAFFAFGQWTVAASFHAFLFKKNGDGDTKRAQEQKTQQTQFFFFPKQNSGTRPHNVGTIPYVLLLDALLTPTVPALPRAASEAPDALLKYCISSTSPLVRYHMPSVRPM